MAPEQKFLSDVTLQLPRNSAFLFRVRRKWTVKDQNMRLGSRVCELVLMDEKRDQIQATVPLHLIPQFEDQIEEGNLYAMLNFSVKENQGGWRATSHPFRLMFTEKTKVMLQTNEKHHEFPKSIYNIIAYADITHSPDVEAPDLIDVIGAYNPDEKPTKPSDGKGSWCRFPLVNLENTKITCTLWNEYSAQFLDFINTTRHDPIIVLLQFCRINTRYVGGTKGVSSAWQFTKLLIDENIPEIEDFRSRYTVAVHQATPSSTFVSKSSTASLTNGEEIGFTKSLSELSTMKEVRGCWFYGVIHAIFSSRNWAYFGCSDAKCCKKLREEDVVCSKCGRSKDEGVWRYTLKMKVRHGTTFADVMFWDEEARLLLGKAAGDFYEHLDVATLRPISCPEVISELIGREYLFKIKSANTNSNYGEQVYVIGMISSDKEKIKQFKMAAGSEETSSEAYNSDEDLELLFESVPTGDSNVVISDTETDEKGTPKSIGRGRESDEAVTGDVNGETQGSSNKKLKVVKIEKP